MPDPILNEELVRALIHAKVGEAREYGVRGVPLEESVRPMHSYSPLTLEHHEQDAGRMKRALIEAMSRERDSMEQAIRLFGLDESRIAPAVNRLLDLEKRKKQLHFERELLRSLASKFSNSVVPPSRARKLWTSKYYDDLDKESAAKLKGHERFIGESMEL